MADLAQVLALYKEVAAVAGGIARTPGEVSEAYVAGFMQKAEDDGVQFVYVDNGVVRGEIHAARPGIACFAHLLTDLTIAVAPACQGQGVGRRLFDALLAEVSEHRPDITRVELFTRESNTRARALYASLGFVEEGRLRARVTDASGQPEADISMGWLRAENARVQSPS
jgi:ribosomal protein S18 acetylase RimI-like enzyme